jgi:hypothetical protein
MLFHIADAPCHGTEFHNIGINLRDTYPDGDPSRRSLNTLFSVLSRNKIQYHFGKITEQTNRMVEKFKKAYNGEFVVCDFKNADRMVESIVSTASISVTRG